MKVSQYSIKDLENLTKIKAHTIRIWEQRYGLLKPQRTATNIRFYLDADLKKLLNVNLLYTNGFKISKISKLSEDEIIEEAKAIMFREAPLDAADVDAAIISIMDMNSSAVIDLFEEHYQNGGLANMYQNLIIPLLGRVGELWQLNTISVGHEHFFSNLLRQFVLAKTYALGTDTTKGTALLFLHENEEHELSLLIYNYLFRSAGWKTCYLGQSVPHEGLEIAYRQINPDITITSFIKQIPETKFQSILNKVLNLVPHKQLLTSGSIVLNYKSSVPNGVQIIENFEDLKKHIS